MSWLRTWVLEPALWIAGLVSLLLVGGLLIGLLLPLHFGPELAAAVAYTVWLIVLVFFPGRHQRARNPFGAAARRVSGPLLLTHLAALACLTPAVAAAAYLRSRYGPRWLSAVCLMFWMALSLWQCIRSTDLLEGSEAALAAGHGRVSVT